MRKKLIFITEILYKELVSYKTNDKKITGIGVK